MPHPAPQGAPGQRLPQGAPGQRPPQGAPGQRPPQRRPQRGGKVELQPIEQEVSEFTATGERLENLPPQQTPTDPNFDTDRYVRNLQRQIKEDQLVSKEENHTEDIIKQAENIPVQTMKFDGKHIRVNNVDVVKAPKQSNKNIVPIVLVVILVAALIGIAVYIFAFSGIFNKQLNVSFDKPTAWDDVVYAIPYTDKSEFKETWNKMSSDSKLKESYKMTRNTGDVYTFKVDSKYKDGYIIFTDDKGNFYPAGTLEDLISGSVSGAKIENNKTYQVDSTSKASVASTAESSK